MLDLELKAGKKERSRQDDHEDVKDNLRIPQVDLFDLFQVNRCKILDYLLNNSDEKNAVSVVTMYIVCMYACMYVCMYVYISILLRLSKHSDVVLYKYFYFFVLRSNNSFTKYMYIYILS